MTQTHSTTSDRKSKHLSFKERSQIELLKEQDHSNRAIARILGRSPQTIHNEIKRGTIKQIRQQKQNGKVYKWYYSKYVAEVGQENYEHQRQNCGRKPLWSYSSDFIDWADQRMLEDKWSPDVVVHRAKEVLDIDPRLIPCTTTLYYWIDCQIMKTRNIDLLEKLRRNTKERVPKTRPHKKVLGTSIDERPEEINERNTFGHWEIDTVIGKKGKDEPVLLTLAERFSRFEVILKIKNKTAQAVEVALRKLQGLAGDHLSLLFKSMTADNGLEFATLSQAVAEQIAVYFAHPYASWERGTSENQHGFIRRFLPKETSMKDITEADCLRIQQWMNNYPRKILDYGTPYEVFVRCLHKERRSLALVPA